MLPCAKSSSQISRSATGKMSSIVKLANAFDAMKIIDEILAAILTVKLEIIRVAIVLALTVTDHFRLTNSGVNFVVEVAKTVIASEWTV